MANAYSERANFLGPVSSTNMQLDMMVLGAKQQAYDANIAKVDSIIEAYGNIPLLRDKDKQTLANNINKMLVEVNSYSKDALTDPNTIRNINQVMKGALTPELMKQSMYARNKTEFDALVNKKREKGDGSYSDVNYQDALDQAQFDAYMRGETDDMGRLAYNDYVDEGKVIRDALVDWGKQFGEDVEIVASPTDIAGITLMSKGKKLSAEKINGFIDSVIGSDQKLRTQMSINSRAQFRGMNDDQFKEMFKSSLDTFEKEANASVLQLKALRDNESKDSPLYKEYDAQISGVNSKLESMKSNLEEGKFNRSQLQFDMYTNNLKYNYSNSYSYDRMESAEFDSTLFNADMKMQELELKREANKLSKEANNIALGLDANGNPLPAGVITEEEIHLGDEATALDKLTAGFNDEFSRLDAELSRHLGAEYTSLDYMGKRKYINTLGDVAGEYNINQSSLPVEVLDSIKAFNGRYKEIAEYKKELFTNIKPIIGQTYEDLLGGGSEVNHNNLAETMPYTAQALKGGKKYSSLTKSEKAIIDAEIAKSIKDFMVDSKEDKQDWGLVVQDLEAKLTPEQKKSLSMSGDKKYNTFGAVGRSLLTAGAQTLDDVSSGIAGIWHRATGNTQQADRSDKEWRENRDRRDNEIDDIWNNTTSWTSYFKPDSNLGNMQSGDIKSAYSLRSKIDNRMGAVKDGMKARKESIMSKRTVEQKATFNPNDKKDQRMVQTIDSYARSKGITPMKGGQYSMKLAGDNYLFSVEVESGSGKNKVVETKEFQVPASQAPAEFRNTLRPKPAVAPESQTMSYKIPDSFEEKNKVTSNFIKSFSSKAPIQALDALYQGQAFSTKQELLAPYEYKLKTQEQIAMANELLQASYAGKSMTLPSGKSVVEVYKDGKPTGFNSNRIYKDGIANVDSYVFASMTNSLIEDYIKENLSKL